MSSKRYPEEFKIETVKQITERGHSVAEVASRIGWLYLAGVLDLFPRQVIGWSMRSRIDSELAINALLMAVLRRKPETPLIVHSDQGSQYSSHDWQDFLKAHGLVASMSRRGNCYDNAVAESFFQLPKRERIRRKTYLNGEEAWRDVFNYIEMFYNPKPTSLLCKQRFSGRVRKPVFQSAAECLLKPGRFRVWHNARVIQMGLRVWEKFSQPFT